MIDGRSPVGAKEKDDTSLVQFTTVTDCRMPPIPIKLWRSIFWIVVLLAIGLVHWISRSGLADVWIALSGSTSAAWVQAVGSILAIVGALSVAIYQQQAQRTLEIERREQELVGVLELIKLLTEYVSMIVRLLDMLARSNPYDNQMITGMKGALHRHIAPESLEREFSVFLNEFNSIPLNKFGNLLKDVSYFRSGISGIPYLIQQLFASLEGTTESTLNFQPRLVFRLAQIDQARKGIHSRANIATHGVAQRWVAAWGRTMRIGPPITVESDFFPHSAYYCDEECQQDGSGMNAPTGPTLQQIRSSYTAADVMPPAGVEFI